MKINWNIFKILVLISLGVFLYSFSKHRNELRKLSKIEIEFVNENGPFITLNTVNKLLIQNNDSVTSIGKETLDLNKMESRLLENPMIKNAEVFITIDGMLGVLVEQRKPIARITGSTSYYLDDQGKKMPLSEVYSARVPIITGSLKSNLTEVTQLLLKINEDEFMRKYVVGLQLENDGTINMKLRKQDFILLFGKPNNIEKKFQKFKAFYKKTKQNNTISNYSSVNLEYENQVVATKKLPHGE